jgi:DNA-binding beta-propeller fold protein YncE
MNRLLCVSMVLMTLTVSARNLRAGVAFSSGPEVRKTQNGGAEILFAISEPSDVEIAVIDSGGKVVRHLAAGVLGGPTPPPLPLKTGLAQALTWDGRDDDGKTVPAGSRVRVRAGMVARFGRMIGGSPYTGNVTDMPYRAPVNGLVVDPAGTLYIKMMSDIHSHGNSGLWPWQLRKFDKEGKYLRTLLPYPPSTDPAKASGFAFISTGTGDFTPVNQNSLYPVFSAFGDEICNRLVDGQVVYVNSRSYELNFLKLDGSNALRTVKMWGAKSDLKCAAWLNIQVAFSPDGKFAYYSNVAGTPYDGKQPSDIDSRWPQGRIYRHDLSGEGKDPEPFFDLTMPDFEKQKYWMPSAWDKKTAAAGIDVDAKGNVVVGDLINQEVVEIGPDGKKLSATKIAWPDKVVASRKTGVLYVVTRGVTRGGLPAGTLVRISGRGATAALSDPLKLTGVVGGAVALDESGSVPILWLAGGGDLVRVEDRDGKLSPVGHGHLNRDTNAIPFIGYMDVDPEAELVYVASQYGGNLYRYNGDTGEGGLLKIKAVDMAIGPGGAIYTWGTSGGYHGPIARYTRELEPAPLPGLAANTYGNLAGRAGRGSAVCGMCVDSKGRVYATEGSNNCHIRVYGADGQLVDFPLRINIGTTDKPVEIPVAVDYVSGYGGSIRVDRQGNIYLLQYGRPKDFKPPAGYEKDEAYSATTGTILKFGPEGARRRTPLDSGGRGGDPLAYEGTFQMYPGCGPISGWRCDGSCACTKPRFDVDAYGRVYMPNAVTFSISVRDNSDNRIVEFGHYGNYDCQGPGSREPSPEIPLGWPVAVGVSDGHIYVGDCLNHRIVRADKTWKAEKVLPL